MSTRVESPKVQSALDLISSLAPGERGVISDVSWDEYEKLLDELGEGYGVRVSYKEGTLEVMAPLYRHERTKEFVLRLVDLLTRELGQKLESAGSITLKRTPPSQGAEPDTCFYVRNADVIARRDEIDLSIDPPPDIVFEVDVTTKSDSKMETYARIGVPEFWRYDRMGFHVYALSEGSFVACGTSIAFAFLKATDLERFVELSIREGQAAALEAFRSWLRTIKPGPQ